MKGRVLVSACLLGAPCRYDGASKPCADVIALKEEYELIPVCPEVLGGLQTPRLPSEIRDGHVIRSDGKDLTDAYRSGAEAALDAAKKNEVLFAVLKEKSPSCGVHFRYDGTFSGKLVPSPGVTASLLRENGIRTLSEDDVMKDG